MIIMRSFVYLAVFLHLSSHASAADLNRLDRSLANEPSYQTGNPRYCLLAFGADAERRAWLVVDGEQVYLDRNGNGDLTEDGERLDARAISNPESQLVETAYHFTDLVDPAAKTFSREDREGAFTLSSTSRYAAFKVDYFVRNPGYVVDSEARQNSLKSWMENSEGIVDVTVTIGGEYVQRGRARFAKKPATAPVIHFDGPMALALWDRGLKLITGTENRLAVNVVTPGIGDKAVTFLCHHKLAESFAVTAEIEYLGKGEKDRLRVLLGQRASDIAFVGSYSTPNDAGIRRARIELTSNGHSDLEISTNTFEVPVISEEEVMPAAELAWDDIDSPGLQLVGKAAPGFAAAFLDGEELSLDQYRGKVVVLSFWATWCGGCIKKLTMIQELSEIHEEQTMVTLAVNCGEEDTKVRQFLNKQPFAFPVVMDPSHELRSKYGVAFLPHTVVVGMSGKVEAVYFNVPKDVLREKLRSLAAPTRKSAGDTE